LARTVPCADRDLPIGLRGLNGGRLRRIVLVEQRKLAGAVVSLALDLRALALEQIGLRLDAEHIGLGVVRLGVEQARHRARDARSKSRDRGHLFAPPS
jgi:hypothetical protein